MSSMKMIESSISDIKHCICIGDSTCWIEEIMFWIGSGLMVCLMLLLLITPWFRNQILQLIRVLLQLIRYMLGSGLVWYMFGSGVGESDDDFRGPIKRWFDGPPINEYFKIKTLVLNSGSSTGTTTTTTSTAPSAARYPELQEIP